MKNITKKEQIFFLFYLPLFALKVFNITADNIILQGIAIACFLMLVMYSIKTTIPLGLFKRLFPVFLLACILTITSGKTGIFFSVLFLFALDGINADNRIYKICFWVGLVFFILAYYHQQNVNVVERFNGGEWVMMQKKSNILYVSFMAVVSLYLLKNRYYIKWKSILLIFLANYAVFNYVGSRTGLICILCLILLLIILRNNQILKNKITGILCVYCSIICFLFSVITGIFYGKHEFLDLLNLGFQGRLEQENMFYNKYPFTLFGQHIFEGVQGGTFWCLDCAYWDMLLNLGIVFTILWLFFTTKVIRFYYNRNQYVEVAILVTYAIYGISETFLSNCFLNMSFFLYAEWMYYRIKRKRYYSGKKI